LSCGAGAICHASARPLEEPRARQVVPVPSHPECRFPELPRFGTSAALAFLEEKETTVLRKILWSVSLGAVMTSLLLPCYGAAPEKIGKVAVAADLVAEAEVKIKSLEESLATDKSYNELKPTSIPTDAGVLAVLAQSITESEEKTAWQASAADVRDGAI